MWAFLTGIFLLRPAGPCLFANCSSLSAFRAIRAAIRGSA